MTRKTISSDQGFSLIELMVVVAVIGILTAVAVPAYLNHVLRTRQADGVHRMMDIKAAQEKFYALNDEYADTFSDISGFVSFDPADTSMFQFSPNDTSALQSYFSFRSANDINGDGSRADCWRISNTLAAPVEVTSGGDCAGDEGLGLSMISGIL